MMSSASFDKDNGKNMNASDEASQPLTNAKAAKVFRSLANSGMDSSERQSMLNVLLNEAELSFERNAMCMHEHDAIVMPMLRRPFPPVSTYSSGFSFFTSVKLEKPIGDKDISIVHLYDAAHRSCSVTLAIEAQTGQITYSSGSRHGVLLFPKATLSVDKWHHLCLIHCRPPNDSHASRIQLFFDGTLAHQYDNAHWPSAPPPSSKVCVAFGNGSSSTTTSNPTTTLQYSQEDALLWSMGTSYMLDDALPPDLPLVLAELAATGYNGNLQDSLGRFLTYQTSTKVNLRLDALSRSSGASKDLSGNALVQVVTGSASSLFPEDRFYFVLNSANIDDERISRRALRKMQEDETTRGAATSAKPAKVMLNQAASLTRDAIEPQSYGYAEVVGAPQRRIKESLGDIVWRLGGFSLLLKFIEESDDGQSLQKSLSLFFYAIQSSWRLSEDVEIARGYEVLNYLMRMKAHLIDLSILDTCAKAIGLLDRASEQECQDAALVNPFLFRILMLDFTLWSRTSVEVQTAHLELINTILRTSRHRRFNAKRVSKMQLTRKLLYMITMLGNPQDNVIPLKSPEQVAMLAIEFVTTLRTALVATFNDVAIRNITTFLATHLCLSPAALRQQQLSSNDNNEASDNQASISAEEARVQLTSPQLAIMVFEMLAELVLERPAFLRKFGSVINARWLRIFVSLTNVARASRLALDIMAALVSSDALYAEQRAASTTERRMRLWYETIQKAEESRIVRIRSDAQEAEAFASRRWHVDMLTDLQRERAIFGAHVGEQKRTFELDPTEGPLRMRAKLRESHPLWSGLKQRSDVGQKFKSLSIGHPDVSTGQEDLNHKTSHNAQPSAETLGTATGDEEDEADISTTSSLVAKQVYNENEDSPNTPTSASDFQVDVDTHDDKYRRIIRSLERGDVIEGVENSLRVVFIEYRASLLIFGKRCFYIIDDYFQRPDGELCNVWDAPEEERDSVVMSTLGGGSGGKHGKKSERANALTLVQQLEGDHHQTRKWKWSDLRLITIKTFLHRRTAVEVTFRDGQTCLLVLATTAQASAVFQTLSTRNRAAAQAFQSLCNGIKVSGGASEENTGKHANVARHSGGSTSNTGGSGGLFRFADAVLGRRGIGAITQRWIERKISNFDYLMCLNIAAGRTYQDITQYPVMPFVLRDYTSENLDLSNPSSFRDLSLPMGGQKESRRLQFQDRYEQLAELFEIEGEGATKPFHYGTHYSTAATVSGFLIRLRPFDKIVKALQGGTFDLPDRTFSSIGHAFSSAAEGSLGDVRELIPEAFYLPDFLLNKNGFDFGRTQNGASIDDVELPPWARGDARLFIKLHRDALESEYVSANLQHWIDLIFGYKQRGPAAIEATNCFHELSYDDGGLDLQRIESPLERQAVLKTIHMFGVCPRQLFQHAHPARQAQMMPKPPSIARTPWLLIQSIAPIRTLKHSGVHFIYAPHASSSFAKEQIAKAFVSPKDYLILPSIGVSLSLGHLDGSVRFYARDNMNVVKSVSEQILPDRASCLADASADRVAMLGGQADGAADTGNASIAGANGSGNSAAGGSSGHTGGQKYARILIGSSRGTLVLCQVEASSRGSGNDQLTLLYASRGHEGAILSLCYSHAWSVIVSGSQDKTAIVWDSHGAYVETLQHSAPVQCVCVSRQGAGYIATAAGATLHVWSINGEAIASIETGSAHDKIASIAFYDGRNGESASLDDDERSACMIFTGHRGKVIGWRCVPDYDRPTSRASDSVRSRWRLEPFHVSEHFDRLESQQDNGNSTALSTVGNPPLVTALHFCGDTLLTGDEHGRLYTWSLPGQAIEVSSSVSNNTCMQCARKFGLFEKRLHCASCGGVFCSSCTYTLPAAAAAAAGGASPLDRERDRFMYCSHCRDHLSILVSRSPVGASPSPSPSPSQS